VENLIYIYKALADSLAQALGISLSRGLIGFINHLLFSGITALIIYFGLKKKHISFGLVFAAVAVGIVFHFVYNSLILYRSPFAIALSLVFGYLFLSFLLYHIDRLYINLPPLKIKNFPANQKA